MFPSRSSLRFATEVRGVREQRPGVAARTLGLAVERATNPVPCCGWPRAPGPSHGGFLSHGTPIAGWFRNVYNGTSQKKRDDLGVALFQETTIYHMAIYWLFPRCLCFHWICMLGSCGSNNSVISVCELFAHLWVCLPVVVGLLLYNFFWVASLGGCLHNQPTIQKHSTTRIYTDISGMDWQQYQIKPDISRYTIV